MYFRTDFTLNGNLTPALASIREQNNAAFNTSTYTNWLNKTTSINIDTSYIFQLSELYDTIPSQTLKHNVVLPELYIKIKTLRIALYRII